MAMTCIATSRLPAFSFALFCALWTINGNSENAAQDCSGAEVIRRVPTAVIESINTASKRHDFEEIVRIAQSENSGIMLRSLYRDSQGRIIQLLVTTPEGCTVFAMNLLADDFRKASGQRPLEGSAPQIDAEGSDSRLRIPDASHRVSGSGAGLGFENEDQLVQNESGGGDFYQVGGNVSQPVLLSKVNAKYSDEARKANYQGVVLVSLIVDAQGNPQSLRVVRPLGKGLDANALEAVRHWKFRPAIKDGKTPVPVKITVLVNFRLDTPTLDSADAQETSGPTEPKAIKTYQTAMEWEKNGDKGAALDAFRKANKQDGGRCSGCLFRAYVDANALGAFKDAAEIAREWLPLASSDPAKAAIRFRLATALQKQCLNVKKDECFTESIGEYRAALELVPGMSIAHFGLGVSLANLHQDNAARSEFDVFLNQDRQNSNLHERAERYVERIELARERMAPPFSVTTLDGQHISLDSLAGKVVLVDFWATWCAPCRNAIPHMREIAHKFATDPFVMLSISLDSDEIQWREFIEKNNMTWMQYRDGSFVGAISKRFNVTAIPATFSIDADGVLEDQRVGDAEIEGKLKRLITKAVKNRPTAPASQDKLPGGAA